MQSPVSTAEADNVIKHAAALATVAKEQQLQQAVATHWGGLQQLEKLVLCQLPGVIAATVPSIAAQLPALQLLELQGCSQCWGMQVGPQCVGLRLVLTADRLVDSDAYWCMCLFLFHW